MKEDAAAAAFGLWTRGTSRVMSGEESAGCMVWIGEEGSGEWGAEEEEEEAAAAQQAAMAQARDSMRLAGPSGGPKSGPTGSASSNTNAEKLSERERSESVSSPRVSEQPKGEVKVFGMNLIIH